MARVVVAEVLPATVHEAESCWYDTSRWVQWVDGLARVSEVRGDWPARGSAVVWESGPAGRGTVLERVVEHEPLSGQVLDVEDDSIRARQSVSFVPTSEGVDVSLSLDYRLKQRSIFNAVIEPLFIRRAIRASLGATLSRFGATLGGVTGAARRADVE